MNNKKFYISPEIGDIDIMESSIMAASRPGTGDLGGDPEEGGAAKGGDLFSDETTEFDD